jgi:ATP-binding cassette subfamily F protein 3
MLSNRLELARGTVVTSTKLRIFFRPAQVDELRIEETRWNTCCVNAKRPNEAARADFGLGADGSIPP